MKSIGMLLILFTWSNFSFALSDTFQLAQIATNTAREIAELERILTEAQKHTQQLSNMADAVDNVQWRAQRLQSWAEDIKMLKENDPQDLAEINSLIKQIKVIKKDADELYYDYSAKSIKNKFSQKKIKRQKQKQIRNMNHYKNDGLRRQKNSGQSMQQVAQNTSAIAYEQAKSNKLMLELLEQQSKIYQLQLENEKRHSAKEALVDAAYEGAKNE